MDQALRCDRPVTLNVPDQSVIIRPDREAAEAVHDDGLIDAYVVGPCSPAVARWAARRGLTPDAVSALSLAAALLAAVWFSAGTRGGLVTGALLLCASYVLGQVGQGRVAGPDARWTGPSGAWPAALLDRVKEFAVYAGLAAGGAAGGLWWAAAGAVSVLSVRHTVEESFSVSRASAVSGRGPSRPNTLLRRAANSLGLPYGERLALIAVLAACTGALPVFAVLLTWGTAVAAAAVSRRTARSLT